MPNHIRVPLLALLACSVACDSSGGENLPEGGFTTGEQTGPTTNTPSTTASGTTASTTEDPSTTGDSSTTGTPTSTTDDTDGGDTTVGVSATDTDESSTTTGSTTDETTTGKTTTDETTTDEATTEEPTTENPTTEDPAACDNGVIDDDEVCFPSSTTLATAVGPSDVAAGDFNGDGSFDVVVTGATGNAVSVHLGDDSGALGAAIDTAVGNNPTRIRAAEFSADDNWDAVVINATDNTVSVLVANGDGTFSETALAVGTNPVDLALGDLSGDGLPEVAVANAGDGNYQTSLNDGTGAMTFIAAWDTGAIAQIDGVELGDIAVGTDLDSFFGGAGAYGASPGIGADGNINDTFVVAGAGGTAIGRFNGGDCNDDGELDVVAVDGDQGRVFYSDGNNGSAVFQDAGFGPHMAVSEAVLADVTGEGREDLVLTASGDDQVVIYPGQGCPTFGAPVSIDVGAAPSGVAVADLNADGVGDIIVTNGDDDNVTILLSNP
ncbi:MAG: VCBS repeat-containing protein [Myxococcota bacterium]